MQFIRDNAINNRTRSTKAYIENHAGYSTNIHADIAIHMSPLLISKIKFNILANGVSPFLERLLVYNFITAHFSKCFTVHSTSNFQNLTG